MDSTSTKDSSNDDEVNISFISNEGDTDVCSTLDADNFDRVNTATCSESDINVFEDNPADMQPPLVHQPLSTTDFPESPSSPVAPSYSPLPTDTETDPPCQKESVPSPQTEERPSICIFCWFKLCGDNIDKNIKRRHVRSDRQTISLHYFHSYAVKDRIESSSLSDNQPQRIPDLSDVLTKVQCSQEDHDSTVEQFSILLARMLCENVKYFKENFSDVVEQHIPHEQSHQMAKKSEVVRRVCSYLGLSC